MRDINHDDIAIIGYAFDFPSGIDSKEKLWEMLRYGKDKIEEIPQDRWDWKKNYDPDPDAIGKSYSYHGAFLDHINKFDPTAFRITPLESKNIDPQQRLTLKTAWRAMENSFLNIEQLKHSNTGVFMGATMDDYLQLQAGVSQGENINQYTHFGGVLNNISGRVSYVYGFRGPSETIDTACSSSMTAISTAIKSINAGDCKIALAGGVNVILNEELYIKFSRTQMLSRTGKCKTFDDSADGYVRGEGCGILVLEKMEEAIKNERNIVAVIRGCTTNHNGNSGGLTVPSGKAQVMLIDHCIEKAGVGVDDIDYIEAHGTGTQLGDKIEVNALQEVFRNRKKALPIGSIKTNIGHLESAAGVAGIIKVLVCMEKEQIAKTINIVKKNQRIAWENSMIMPAEENISWNKEKMIAGVSSFGANGSNGHIILQKYTNHFEKISDVKMPGLALAVSAKSEVALKKLMIVMYEYVQNESEELLHIICNKYNCTRTHYAHRVGIWGGNKSEFLNHFKEKLSNILSKNDKNERAIKGGLKNVEMGLDQAITYYENGTDIDWQSLYPTVDIQIDLLPCYQFDEDIHWVDQIRKNVKSKKEIFFLEEYIEHIREIENKSDHCYEFILKTESYFIKEHMVKDKCVLVGTFQIVLLEALIKYILNKKVCVSDYTKMRKIVLPKNKILRIKLLEEESHMMGSLLYINDETNDWEEASSFSLTDHEKEQTIQQYEEESGELYDKDEFYQVLYNSGLILGENYQIMDFIIKGDKSAYAEILTTDFEIGILDAASQLLYLFRKDNALYLPYHFKKFTLYGEISEINKVAVEIISNNEMEIIANLRYFKNEQLIAEYNKYCIRKLNEDKEVILKKILGKKHTLPEGKELFIKDLDILETKLYDHKVYHRLTIPGAYFISQAMYWAETKLNSKKYVLKDINFHQAIIGTEDTKIKQLVLCENTENDYKIDFHSTINDKEEYVQNAQIHLLSVQVPNECIEFEEINSSSHHYNQNDILKIQSKNGLNLGVTFNWIKEAWVAENVVQVRLENSCFNEFIDSKLIPPGLIDTAVQVLGLIKNIGENDQGAFIPLAVEEMIKYNDFQPDMWCIAKQVRMNGDILVGDIFYLDPTKRHIICKMNHMTLIKADQRKLGDVGTNKRLLYQETWIQDNTLETYEAKKINHVIELKLCLNTRKIMMTIHRIKGCEMDTEPKLLIDFYDNELVTQILSEKLKQKNTMLVLCHTGDKLSYHQIELAEVMMEYSELVTAFYLETLRIIQSNDLKNFYLCVISNGYYKTKRNFNYFTDSITWGLFRSIILEIEEFPVLLMDSHVGWEKDLTIISKAFSAENKLLCIEKGIPYRNTVESIKGSRLENIKIDKEKYYIIFGGFGALGYEACKWLIRNGVNHLVVIGRSEVKEEKIKALERLGSEIDVCYIQLDVAEKNAYQKIAQLLQNRSLGGILYSIGVVIDKYHTNYSKDEIHQVYTSKIMGMYHLAKVIENLDFDFCICYSSLVGVMGAEGQSVYGAANSVLDFICNDLREKGKNITSIQWGPIGENGMFSRIDEKAANRYKSRNINILTARQGEEGLQLAVTVNDNIIIADMELEKKDYASVYKNQNIIIEPIIENKSIDILGEVMRVIASFIGLSTVENLNPNQSLIEIGIDSLLMVKIRVKINQIFNVNLPLDLIFKDITIKQIADFVLG